ncbi:MAG: ABC transporter ATP-binding protein [Chloroflexota bacterium]
MNQAMIQVQDFTKTYRDFKAVKGITFNVYGGEIFALLGPNGAGKTSTLESLEGLRQPNGGRLSVAGIDPAKQHHLLRNIIGVQLQSSGLPDTITPDEAMRLFCAYHKVDPRFDLLDRLGLASKRVTQYHQLSTGQQRRLALALAVAHDPKVLFLDEPTAGLDVATRAELHDLMRELRSEGATIILATHDMAEAEELSDRIAILLDGNLAALGTPLEITATGSQLTKISVRTQNSTLIEQTIIFPGVCHHTTKGNYQIYFSESIGITVAAIIDHLQTEDDTLIDLRVERPSLEDRFLEITSKGLNQ